MIKFDDLETTVLHNFKNGEGYVDAKMFVDDKVRIMRLELLKGSSVGMHTHETSSEIIYVISGEATCILDGKVEIVSAGNCHYCPKGSTHTIVNNNNETLIVFAVVSNQ